MADPYDEAMDPFEGAEGVDESFGDLWQTDTSQTRIRVILEHVPEAPAGHRMVGEIEMWVQVGGHQQHRQRSITKQDMTAAQRLDFEAWLETIYEKVNAKLVQP